jgi:DNA replication initiation complex subunit (GINS family)
MAQPNIVKDVSDRVESAVKSFERDLKTFQKAADKRRKTLEKRAEREVKRVRREIENNAVVKRAQTLRSDAVKAVETRVEALLGTLRIASQGEVAKLERKVGALNRKVRALEKELEAA